MRSLVLRVIERIKDPEHWTQHAFARDKEDRQVSPRSENAVCWCVMGAVRKELGYGSVGVEMELHRLYYKVSRPGTFSNLIDTNDKCDHKTVISELQRLADSLP